jgi:hypothetical protein
VRSKFPGFCQVVAAASKIGQYVPLQKQLAISKSRFSCSVIAGIFNIHNSLFWGEANPHAAFVHCHQKCFAVSVWASFVRDSLIGSYVLLSRFSAQIDWVFLEEMLPELLEEIPLALRRNMWFQHNGAAGH